MKRYGFFIWTRWRAGGSPQSRDAGFTLIEMMVALAVFSLAALALIRMESATIRGATILDDTLMAQTVARNIAVEAVTDARPPTLGTATGIEENGGRAWQWTRQVSPTGDARILRIDVAAGGTVGTQQGHITMVRVALPPDIPPPNPAAPGNTS